MSESLIEAVNDMHRATEAAYREQLGLDESWVMRDLPWMLQEYYEQITTAMGEDNYRFVSGSSMSGDKTVRVRATLMINQQGLAGIKKLAEQIRT